MSSNGSVKAQSKPTRYREYTYESLQEYRSSIRVLVLHGNGAANAEVECELLTIDFKKGRRLQHHYEALSWCWGAAKATGRIIIIKDGKFQKRVMKMVTPDLEAALKALRYQRRSRYLWIDQICINQDNPVEKNHQVEMMAEIYGRALKVCIWLGEGDRQSKMALEFIKNEVLQLHNFDELCESEKASQKWGALLELMQRPWFSRRWVVQEIALAHGAVVYCGSDKISWKKFAVAVELFVEVETATHRLSEVMKKDPRYYHVPGWFEYVSALGASLLVEATGKLFRDYKPNGPLMDSDDCDSESDLDETERYDDDIDSDEEQSELDSQDELIADDEEDIDEEVKVHRNHRSAGPEFNRQSLGQPLLPLEYLVSSLSIFEMRMPHDAIYSLLAIARDTTPLADDGGGFRRVLLSTQEALEGFTQKKRYKVDYQQPFADVCQEFISFCVQQSKDRTRALDILCRPWAPGVTTEEPRGALKNKRARRIVGGKQRAPSARMDGNSAMRNNGDTSRNRARTNSRSPTGIQPLVQAQQQKKPAVKKGGVDEPATDLEHNLPLPSWVQPLSGAPYAMYSQAGIHTLKMGRKNADTLVGLPASSQSLERNYNAAETRDVDMKTLRFVKRVQMGHWSMYVKGFILDKIAEILPSSQGGAIPTRWAEAGGWRDVPNQDPPDAFWRTMVADRGRDGRNPPVYYSRACKESFIKGGFTSGSVNTSDLINNERCSVIAQFCRRVQAVIWNRCLVKTVSKRLGLTQQDVQRRDLVCILYGCSVPVILRPIPKTVESVKAEAEDSLAQAQKRIKTAFRRLLRNRKYHRLIKNGDRALNHKWQEAQVFDWWKDCHKTWNEWMNHVKYRPVTPSAKIAYATGSTSHVWVTVDDTITVMIAINLDLFTDTPRDADQSFETRRKIALRAQLQWRAIEEWKSKQREEWKSRCEQEEGHGRKTKADEEEAGKKSRAYRREDMHRFDLYLRWGRRWKAIWKVRTKKRDPETVGEETSKNAESAKPNGHAFSGLGVVLEEESDVDSTPQIHGPNDGDWTGERDDKEALAGNRANGTWNNQSAKSTPGDLALNGNQDETFVPFLKHQGTGLTDDSFASRIARRYTTQSEEAEHTSHIPPAAAVRLPSDDSYIQRYLDWYIAPYKLDKGGELEEPDWDDHSSENLPHLDRWTYYKFMGESYVHGMMDGEAMAHQNENAIPARVFELR